MAKTQQAATVKIGDAEYPLDDLTFNELTELEDALGAGMQDVDWASARAMRQLVYTFRRRAEPDITLEQVGAEMTLRDFNKNGEAVKTDPPA